MNERSVNCIKFNVLYVIVRNSQRDTFWTSVLFKRLADKLRSVNRRREILCPIFYHGNSFHENVSGNVSLQFTISTVAVGFCKKYYNNVWKTVWRARIWNREKKCIFFFGIWILKRVFLFLFCVFLLAISLN